MRDIRDVCQVYFDRNAKDTPPAYGTDDVVRLLRRGYFDHVLTVSANNSEFREVYLDLANHRLWDVTYEARGPGHFDLIRLALLRPSSYVKPREQVGEP